MKSILFTVSFLCTLTSFAEDKTTSSTNQTVSEKKQSLSNKILSKTGISYFSFFNGPGLKSELNGVTPNQLGKPDDDGVSFFNLVSLKYKTSENIALDLQTRFEVFINNGVGTDEFSAFRWESPRIGFSGNLIKKETWAVSGAINTDFPHFLPSPLTGFTARERKVVFNPGMFGSLSIHPKDSRWSFFGVLAPRYFFYADREAAESQMKRGGMTAGNKPELVLAILPTLNRHITDKTSLSLGATIDYRKQVLSKWNPLSASLATNGDSSSWRLLAVPVTFGVTHDFNSKIKIYPYLQAFPIAAQRINAISREKSTLLETASLGMWIYGTIF
jgi:hypothetical protein